MKLEVGKWCRTKKGTIFKIIGGNVDMWEIDIDYSYLSKCENEDYNSYAYNKNNSLFEELVVKASYNIVDVLEVGDIIRYRINKVSLETKGYLTGVIDITDEEMIESIKEDKNYHVLQILTKEQFEEMSYKVKESK